MIGQSLNSAVWIMSALLYNRPMPIQTLGAPVALLVYSQNHAAGQTQPATLKEYLVMCCVLWSIYEFTVVLGCHVISGIILINNDAHKLKY